MKGTSSEKRIPGLRTKTKVQIKRIGIVLCKKTGAIGCMSEKKIKFGRKKGVSPVDEETLFSYVDWLQIPDRFYTS